MTDKLTKKLFGQNFVAGFKGFSYEINCIGYIPAQPSLPVSSTVSWVSGICLVENRLRNESSRFRGGFCKITK